VQLASTVRTTSYAEEVPVYTARTSDCGPVTTVATRTGDCGQIVTRTGDCGHATHTGDCGHISSVTYSESVYTDEASGTYSSSDQQYETRTVSDRSSEGSIRPGSFHDRNFIEDAAMANLTEIELGRLALKNAENEEVRRFGQRMIDDHTKAQSDLRAAAASSFDVPSELDAEHRQIVDRHARLSGREFDRAYMDMMVNDHSKVIGKFERASESARDSGIRDFASRTLPTLQGHLKLARDTQEQLSSNRASRD
jgi:putative membrane protein